MVKEAELKERRNRFSIRLGAIVLLLLATACATTAPEAAAIPSSTDTQMQPLPTITVPEPSVQPQETVATISSNESGPWLLVSTMQGLLKFNPDGSGRTVLTDQPVLAPGSLQNAISPSGDMLAFITSSNPSRFLSGFFYDLTLQIISFPTATPLLSQRLTSPETEPAPDPETGLLMGTTQYNIALALTQFPSFAWAPQGSRLAFLGAFDGPSADVYTYRTADGAIERRTDGPDQAYRPFWSPDGRYLIQTSASGFGTGAGFGITGIYATRINEGDNFSLYDIPARSGDEIGLGWLDSETLAVETWSVTCGYSNLRLVNLATREVTVLKEGCVPAAAVEKPGGTLVFSTDDGLYQVTADSPSAVKIGEQIFRQIQWSAEADAFYGQSADGAVFEIKPAGSIQLTPSKGFPIVSPDGRYWAWIPVYYSETMTGGWAGVWAGERGQVQSQIFPGAVPNAGGIAQLLWAPDSQSFFFVDAQGNLYQTWISDWNPKLIVSGLEFDHNGLSLAWAG